MKIVEGEKERIQVFTGTVVGRSGTGISKTCRVRRIVAGQGVERVFPLHSPRVVDVEVVRKGKTRRAKLYFLRDRIGKATRLKDVRVKPRAQEAQAAAEAQVDEGASGSEA